MFFISLLVTLKLQHYNWLKLWRSQTGAVLAQHKKQNFLYDLDFWFCWIHFKRFSMKL